MNKLIQRIVTAFLAIAMVITILEPVTAQAATKTESMTLYKGEEAYISVLGDVKSVSSSKKSVVAVSKDKQYSSRANLSAKKTGKSTVTIKTSRGTLKYVVTVKKLDITGKITDLGNGYLLLAVKNNTKQTFTAVQMSYTLKNDLGETVVKDTKLVSDVVAGKTVYSKISYDSYSYNVDASQCSAKAIADNRSLTAKYKNVSSKITKKVTEEDDGNGTLTLTVKSKSTLKKDRATGTHYVLVYDAQDNIIDLKTVYVSLKAGATDTYSTKIYYGPYSGCENYDHYKIVTVAYSTSY